MSFFDSLFGNSPQPANNPQLAQQLGYPSTQPQLPAAFGGQQPQPGQANPLPVQPPTDYATFVKNLADAAAANIHARTWSQRGWFNAMSGDDLAAAQANVTAGAPQAWDAYQTADTASKAAQLGFLQRLALPSVVSGQNIDPNNIMGSLSAYLKAMRDQNQDLAPQEGNPQAQPAQGQPQSGQPPIDPATAPTAGAVPNPAPFTMAPLPAPVGMQNGSDDPGAMFTRLASNLPAMPNMTGNPSAAPGTPAPMVTPTAANVAPNVAPNGGQPAVNPLAATRRSLELQARYAQLNGDYESAAKLRATARQGLLPGEDIAPDGTTVDAGNGAPLGMSAQDYSAQGAGKVATAQQYPHVVAEGVLNQQQHGYKIGEEQNSANLQRGTDAARIAGENFYKPPVLMRSPDGSIVGVTPDQMAAATRTGALTGYRPLTDEETKAQQAYGEQYVKEQATFPELRQTQNTIGTMLDNSDAFPTGTFGELKQSAGRLLVGIGADPDAVAKAVGNPASADVLVKQTFSLAVQKLKQSFGASREAGFIVQATQRANPNIETMPEAFHYMLSTMNQEAQRQVDYLTGQQAYRQQHGTIDGWQEQFDRTNPVSAYANEAMRATYGAPSGSRFLGRSNGKPIFQLPNGQKVAVH